MKSRARLGATTLHRTTIDVATNERSQRPAERDRETDKKELAFSIIRNTI
jgi:hypothetical protein